VTARFIKRCPPVLIAAIALTASCSSTPPQPQHLNVADTLLAGRVYAALDDDPIYFYRHVDVIADEGVVRLSGYVWSADAIYHARRITAGIPGVTRVVTTGLELERNGHSNSSGHGR
jgi:osmotically-inducible protein OsmY